ncbi:MAG: hypothetical protein MJ025_02145 [Victivallaceae bacterium]|nr:hypothetical protein [Victivallaceae bacterium]
MTDEERTEKLVAVAQEEIRDLITSAAMQIVVAAVTGVIKNLSATNRKKSTVAGDSNLHPTKQDTSLQKNETSSGATKQSMAKDEVSAQNGAVEASSTNAKASKVDTEASNVKATASKTQAGAADIGTKGLKMM